MEQQKYFKAGEFATVRATHNGFIVDTDEGEYVAKDANEMLALVLGATTTFLEQVKQKQQLDAAVAEAQQSAADADAAAVAEVVEVDPQAEAA